MENYDDSRLYVEGSVREMSQHNQALLLYELHAMSVSPLALGRNK